MRGKDFNAGLRGVLFEARHYERMGSAVWLYGWLVLRQTHQSGAVGWVLGGAPVRYGEIEEETGFNVRTLERWMAALRRHGYIETETAPGGVIVRITKAKKFPQGVRRNAESVRKSAYGGPQKCVRNPPHAAQPARVAPPMGSSSVEGVQSLSANAAPEDFAPREPGGARQNPIRSWDEENRNAAPGTSWRHAAQPQNMARNSFAELRGERQRRRDERESAVRRELAAGSGPEVRRP